MFHSRGLDWMHHKIYVKDYPNLGHDSYINCTDIYTALDEKDVTKQLLADPTRVKDMLKQDDRLQIIELTAQSKQIAPMDKELIRLAFTF